MITAALDTIAFRVTARRRPLLAADTVPPHRGSRTTPHLEARVAVAGCGALGSFQAGALARAGAGYLRLIDRDYVDLSNLQRQWLYEESDARDGLPKAIAAARRLAAIDSGVAQDARTADLTARNIDEMFDGIDLILDGTDNFQTRYLINDFAVQRDFRGSTAAPWAAMESRCRLCQAIRRA